MALKPRTKHKIFWTGIICAASLVVATIMIPPMITLNKLKPNIESAILEQTSIPAKINGNVHFSLLGHTTIVAHNVELPNGTIGAVMFTVPFRSIFNLASAPLTGDIAIYNANILSDTIIPKITDHDIEIHDSNIVFLGRDHEIIHAKLSGGHLTGTMRINNHKFDVDFSPDAYYMHNHDDRFDVSGQLFENGTSRGNLTLHTSRLNEIIGVPYPDFGNDVNLRANYEWDGKFGFKFSDIATDNFSGNIEISPDGSRNIQIVANDVDWDFSFLTRPSDLYNRATLDIDMHGKLKFANREFEHVKINAIGTPDVLQISNIIADNIAINGGYIDSDGAHNIMISMPFDGAPATCLFSGAPNKWNCHQFMYKNLTGNLTVDGDDFTIFITSPDNMPERKTLSAQLKKLGNHGTVNFSFNDVGGSYKYDATGNSEIKYDFARNKNLNWLKTNITILPEHMQTAMGDFVWDENNSMRFMPYNKKWALAILDGWFYITGQNFHDLFPDIDLQSLNNAPYTISGLFNGDNISDLIINIAGHEFHGAAVDGRITLKTKILNLDTFLSQQFTDNYSDLEFLTTSPIMIPFELGTTLSLSADTLIYNGNEYAKFVYSLTPDVQTFSISDSARGNLLTTITRVGTKYEIFAQLNRFKTDGALLSAQMPLNISDTIITGEITGTTWGHIAHDLEYNLSGTIDAVFEGGYLSGIGIDNFFASAPNITTFNGEYALSDALESGTSVLKKMRVIGKFANGDFITTVPIELQLRHTDATGNIEIANGEMNARLDMVLRGTSPAPAPLKLVVYPDNRRSYSLTEIMANFDPTFMRDFVKSHNKF